MSQSEGVRQAATEMRRHFRLAVQHDGETYWRHDDTARALLLALAVHDDGLMMPDDYRYEMLVDALTALAESPDPDAAEDYLSDAPVYTSDLLSWLSSGRLDRVDAAIKDWPDAAGLGEWMGIAYAEEQRDTLAVVRRWLERHADD